MKSKNNQTTLGIKDIENILILACWGPETIKFVIDYGNKTPDEKEEFNKNVKENAMKIVKKALALAKLYYESPENEKKALLTEIQKLGEKQAIAELHEILGINTPDYSNEMTFTNPYQYPKDR